MTLNNLIINSFLLVIFLVILNRVISISKVLVDDSSISVHKYKLNKIIPLSGGIFFFNAIFYFHFNHLSELTILFHGLPLLIIGILSDKDILKSPIWRLLLQALFIFTAIKFLNIVIATDRIPFINILLNNNFFNNLFVLFCLLVLINGSNFIDGLNGLSSGYYLLLISSVLFIDKNLILNIENNIFIICLFLSILIFFLFNLFNRNFMGDNGIYFLSFYVGIKLIQTYNDNELNLSPFYIASLLWYPVFENLFSIIRRVNFSKNISRPDNLHLHALLYNKIKSSIFKKNSNSITSLIILFFCLPGFYFSTIYHNQTIVLCFVILLNIILYLGTYKFLRK